ncbi:MerR family transcriptional regulator [Neobacillus mesonae]|uniref:MerR family transcriptional regulator n=1 Tax=Neobacillus mesonae TaxID=1193713 RepID=UPI00204003C5|nr:MerR family transcriptional regulator [Neobacillus mesonae]MCM3568922.1 MerR family transcriptional regulator [Neobacillus mesonae]
MKTYTLKEVAKKINTAPGIIRQWEKELNELIQIPRSKQGARIYTDREIEQLLEIKEMVSQKLSKEMIRYNLQKKLTPESGTSAEAAEWLDGSNTTGIPNTAEHLKTSNKAEIAEPDETAFEVVAADSITPVSVKEDHNIDASLLYEAVDTFKNNFINEVKEEIRTVVRKEIIEEVKKEISKGTLTTVKALSDSIYKSTASTKEEIEGLSKTVERASELTADKIHYLSNSIKDVSIETSDELAALSKQLTETTNDLAHTIDYTNSELSGLTEAIALDREFFVEERQQYVKEIRQREAAFQQMLTNFREVASAKEKKWWKFWS